MDEQMSMVWRFLAQMDRQEAELLEAVRQSGAMVGEVDTVMRIDRLPGKGWFSSMRMDLN